VNPLLYRSRSGEQRGQRLGFDVRAKRPNFPQRRSRSVNPTERQLLAAALSENYALCSWLAIAVSLRTMLKRKLGTRLFVGPTLVLVQQRPTPANTCARRLCCKSREPAARRHCKVTLALSEHPLRQTLVSGDMRTSTASGNNPARQTVQLVHRLQRLFVSIRSAVRAPLLSRTDGTSDLERLRPQQSVLASKERGELHVSCLSSTACSPSNTDDTAGHDCDIGRTREADQRWGVAAPLTEVTAASSEFQYRSSEEQLQSSGRAHRSRVVLLCGIPGSGKSTFAKLVLKHGGENWVRVSQDDLGSRQECERMMQEALTSDPPRHVIVDRCNVDSAQRAVWIAIAAQANAYPVGVLLFPVPLDECIRRVLLRGPNHPTLFESTENDVVKVVTSFAGKWENPSPGEGIGFCRIVASPADEERVMAELLC
jgi:hypothetical protein